MHRPPLFARCPGRPRSSLILGALALWLLAICTPALAGEGPTSAEEARVRQALQTPVGEAPLARLHVAEVIAALGQPETADALRAALLGLQWRTLDGAAMDPNATLASLLPSTPEATPLGPESEAANAWSVAVATHVRLRFFDAQDSAAHPLAVSERAGRLEVAPGMWVSSAPVGSMVLLVRVHQLPQARLALSRLHVKWLGTNLACAPVQGLVTVEQDGLFSCEGNSRAAEQAPRVLAVTSSPARELVGDVTPGEFDSPRATSAWIDALGAGHDAELKAMLQRSAPCESVQEVASRCQPHEVLEAQKAQAELAADAALYKALPRHAQRAPSSRLSGQDLSRILSWFCAGAAVCWILCSLLPTRSIVVTVAVHVAVTMGLATAGFWVGFLVWAKYTNEHREEAAVAALFGFGIYGVVALGIAAGGLAHLLRRLVLMVRGGPLWA